MDWHAEAKVRAYRMVGVTSLSFAALALLSLCVTLPLAHNYAQHLVEKTQAEMAECRVSSLFFSLRS